VFGISGILVVFSLVSSFLQRGSVPIDEAIRKGQILKKKGVTMGGFERQGDRA